jgi:hypothetical protein
MQIVELVKIAKATGHLWTIPQTCPPIGDLPQTWAMCHIHDCAGGYLAVLDRTVAGDLLESRVYFEAADTFSWETLSKLILHGLGLDETVDMANDEDMREIAKAVGAPLEETPMLMSGR